MAERECADSRFSRGDAEYDRQGDRLFLRLHRLAPKEKACGPQQKLPRAADLLTLGIPVR